jgi:hypothetical protein
MTRQAAASLFRAEWWWLQAAVSLFRAAWVQRRGVGLPFRAGLPMPPVAATARPVGLSMRRAAGRGPVGSAARSMQAAANAVYRVARVPFPAGEPPAHLSAAPSGLALPATDRAAPPARGGPAARACRGAAAHRRTRLAPMAGSAAPQRAEWVQCRMRRAVTAPPRAHRQLAGAVRGPPGPARRDAARAPQPLRPGHLAARCRAARQVRHRPALRVRDPGPLHPVEIPVPAMPSLRRATPPAHRVRRRGAAHRTARLARRVRGSGAPRRPRTRLLSVPEPRPRKGPLAP